MSSTQPDPGPEPSTEAGHRRPRWVTVALAVAVLLVVAFVVLHLAGGGFGGHLPAGGH